MLLCTITPLVQASEAIHGHIADLTSLVAELTRDLLRNKSNSPADVTSQPLLGLGQEGKCPSFSLSRTASGSSYSEEPPVGLTVAPVASPRISAENVRGSVSAPASAPVSVAASVRNSVLGSVRNSVLGSASVRNSVLGSVRNSVLGTASVRNSVLGSVRNSVLGSARNSVQDPGLVSTTRGSVTASVVHTADI